MCECVRLVGISATAEEDSLGEGMQGRQGTPTMFSRVTQNAAERMKQMRFTHCGHTQRSHSHCRPLSS